MSLVWLLPVISSLLFFLPLKGIHHVSESLPPLQQQKQIQGLIYGLCFVTSCGLNNRSFLKKKDNFSAPVYRLLRPAVAGSGAAPDVQVLH